MEVVRAPAGESPLAWLRGQLQAARSPPIGRCARVILGRRRVRSVVRVPMVAVFVLKGDCSLSFTGKRWYRLRDREMMRLPCTYGSLSASASREGTEFYLVHADAPCLTSPESTSCLSFLTSRRKAMASGTHSQWAAERLPLGSCTCSGAISRVMGVLATAARRRHYLPFHENRSVVVPASGRAVFQVVASPQPGRAFLTFGPDHGETSFSRSDQEGLVGVDPLDALCPHGGLLADGTSPFRDHEVICCTHGDRVWWFVGARRMAKTMAFFGVLQGAFSTLESRLRSPVGPVLPLATCLHTDAEQVCRDEIDIGRQTGIDGYWCPRLLALDRSGEPFTVKEIRSSSAGSIHQLARTCVTLLTSYGFRGMRKEVYDSCKSYTPKQWKTFLDRASSEMRRDRDRIWGRGSPPEESVPTNNTVLRRFLLRLSCLETCSHGGCHLLAAGVCVKCGKRAGTLSDDRSMISPGLSRYLQTTSPRQTGFDKELWDFETGDAPLMQRLSDRGYLTGVCPVSHMQLGSSVPAISVRVRRRPAGGLQVLLRD